MTPSRAAARSMDRARHRSVRFRTAAARILLALLGLALAACGRGPSQLSPLSPPGLARGPSAVEPTIALDPRGRHVMLAWLADDGVGWRLWFARSSDAGASWSEPVLVSAPGERLAPGGESSPRIACDAQERVAVVWTTAAASPALRFARSLDGGRTWAAPVTLDGDTTTGVAQGHADVVSTDDGRLLVAWLDSRPGGDGARMDPLAGGGAGESHVPTDARSVRLLRSLDFGGQWSAASPQWSRACPCCRMAAALGSIGTEFVAYRRQGPGVVRDVALSRPDGRPVRVFADGWSAEACPESGPAFTMARDGTMRVAWYTGAPGRAGVWFRQGIAETYDSTVTPLAVLAAERPGVTHVSLGDAGMGGTLIACDGDSTGPGGLALLRVEPSGRRVVERLAAPRAQGASRPQVACLNTSRRAFVAWTERDGERSSVRLLRWDVGR